MAHDAGSSGSGDLPAWVAAVTGARDVAIEPLALLGMTREMLGVAGTYPDGSPLSAVLRRESGHGAFAGTMFTLAREAQTLRAVSGIVAAPRVLAVADDGRMFLMERLRGTAAWSFADRGEERQTVRAFLASLAALHAADIRGLALPVARHETPARQLLADIDDYETAYRAYCPARLAIEAALDRVKGHVPPDLRVCLLHGDAGPGNFMHEAGVVTGLIDWELSHLGDPMDDLAWLWFRKSVLRQDDDLAEWFSIYEALSRRPIDVDQLRFFRVVVLLRTSIAALLTLVRNPGPIEAMVDKVCDMLGAALREQGGERVAADVLPPLC